MHLESALFLVEAIAAYDSGLGATSTQVARGCRIQDRVARRHLREFEQLGFAQSAQTKEHGHPLYWSLTEKGRLLLQAAQYRLVEEPEEEPAEEPDVSPG